MCLLCFIDSHDFILRFNNAPTQGFEDDVGALTSMRIINSQVATKPIFGFPKASYFTTTSSNKKLSTKNTNNAGSNKSNNSNTTATPAPETVVTNLDTLWDATRKFLIWDPCNYGSTIEQVSLKLRKNISYKANVLSRM